MMGKTNLELVLTVLAQRGFGSLDLTGGAPELHPLFRHLVHGARQIRVADLCYGCTAGQGSSCSGALS